MSVQTMRFTCRRKSVSGSGKSQQQALEKGGLWSALFLFLHFCRKMLVPLWFVRCTLRYRCFGTEMMGKEDAEAENGARLL
jgi:hypothetical protein